MSGKQDTGRNRQPWFAPKRVGYGLRPTTWQGWAVIVAAVVVIVVVATLV